MGNSRYRFAVLFSLFAAILTVSLLGYREFAPLLVPVVFAHCDTMEGPVVKAAQKALETGNVSSVLIWVQKKDEAEIKKAFEKTLTVRKLSPEAKEVADMHFFETLVRIHRAGEGEPYTGLEPAGAKVEPGIVAADKAVESGSVDDLVKEVTSAVESGIRERFERVMATKKHKEESVEKGREYVEAYVTFIHYVEGLHTAALVEAAHHGKSEGAKSEEHHKH